VLGEEEGGKQEDEVVSWWFCFSYCLTGLRTFWHNIDLAVPS